MQFDQADSNATVSFTCNPDGTGGGTVSIDNGHAVYFPSSSVSATGTYAVQPDGTGELDGISSTGAFKIIIRLAGSDTKGLATIVLMHIIPDCNLPNINPGCHIDDAVGRAVLE